MLKKKKINDIFDYLFPICRSISGVGYRDSIEYLKRFIPLKIHKFKSNKKVFDWEIPNEWNITDGYIKFENKKILDFKKNNLHVINYSAPINKTLDLTELKKNIFYIRKYPKLIPYVTSYYKKKWGFCLSYEKYKKLKNGKYDVRIKSSFKKGHIQNGLAILKGKSDKICLISSYLCHPSMANNELSGPLTLLLIYEKIKKWNNRNLTYYFLINPETIGSVAFLSKYEKQLKKNLHSGIVLTCLGGPKEKLSYKLSRSNLSPLDKVMKHYNNKGMIQIRKFDPMDGSDERQYCAGKMNLPVGQISRTVYGTYKEYHTSGDNKKFMNINKIMESSNIIEKILKDNDKTKMIHRFEDNCELQLGKRNLYPNLNFAHSKNNNNINLNATDFKIMINILSYADGHHNIFDIEKLTNFKINKIEKIIELLIKKKLIYLKI
tara:strand:+ start:569 stop:1873 length:1305 start_codon:yes stop_codon:yes gene_type:complete